MIPHPLFETMDNLLETPECVINHLKTIAIPDSAKEYALCQEFLKSYANSADTFNAYRRELERLLQWAWLILKKPLKQINRNDIRDYLAFTQEPPATWVATKTANRFIHNGLGLRVANPEWRPFVNRLSKIERKHGKTIEQSAYHLSSKSTEAIFAILSSLFTFLQQENYTDVNPISLIRQKKGYIQRQQVRHITRKLSRLQWNTVIQVAETMALDNAEHQRTLFLMSAFYLLGVRISELAYHDGRNATMGHFAPDKEGLWWFTTVGKGNKMRDIAVPDELLQALKTYRTHLNLPPLPRRDEPTPLLPKLKGKQGLGTRQIRNLVQAVFDRAIQQLQTEGKIDEADDLATATVHWLRHTAISTDVESRPREHIRDDVGHENAGTMDKYIDIDRTARHHSAKNKKLKPELKPID